MEGRIVKPGIDDIQTDRRAEQSLRKTKQKRQEKRREKREEGDLISFIQAMSYSEFMNHPKPVAALEALHKILRHAKSDEFYAPSRQYKECKGPYLFEKAETLQRLVALMRHPDQEVLLLTTKCLVAVSAHEELEVWTTRLVASGLLAPSGGKPYIFHLLETHPSAHVRENIIQIFANFCLDNAYHAHKLIGETPLIQLVIKSFDANNVSMMSTICYFFRGIFKYGVPDYLIVRDLWCMMISRFWITLRRDVPDELVKDALYGFRAGVTSGSTEYRVSLADMALIEFESDVQVVAGLAADQKLRDRIWPRVFERVCAQHLMNRDPEVRRFAARTLHNLACRNDSAIAFATNPIYMRNLVTQYMDCDVHEIRKNLQISLCMLTKSMCDIGTKPAMEYPFLIVRDMLFATGIDSDELNRWGLEALRAIKSINPSYVRKQIEENDLLERLEYLATNHPDQIIQTLAEVHLTNFEL